jgi:hypothetical protein
VIFTDLSAGLETDSLQCACCNNVYSDEKVVKQRNVTIAQLGKVGCVNVGREECVGNVVAQKCHTLDQLFYGAQKVESNEPDSVVLP